jgi:hypothetical protein
MLGLLSAGDQQRCLLAYLLAYLPLDEPPEQVQQPVPIGGR